MRGTAAVAVLVAALAGVAGCGGTPAPGAAGTGTPSAPASAPGSPAASPTAAAPTVRVEVKAGKVIAGSGRHDVKQGSRVVIEFVSDKADEVHVHGYDKTVALKPGEPARLEFTADIPGVFEVELHEAGLLLCELQVQ